MNYDLFSVDCVEHEEETTDKHTEGETEVSTTLEKNENCTNIELKFDFSLSQTVHELCEKWESYSDDGE